MEDLSTGLIDRAKSRVGNLLRDKWRLDRLLGIGGMAAVYAATHRNGSRGAIKMLHPELSIDAEVKRRFLREGYVANAVDHPGTVKVLDDDVSDDGAVFIVMELLEGETLEAYAERRGGRLPPGEILPLVDQLLDVLNVAHARGVVHRDIKPENVFVTREGVVKLLDFGIARLRLNKGSMATVNGATFGTPAFMPPEQALGRTNEVDARSDVWAVGATLFTLLAGRVVHVTETLNEQLVAHAAMRAPSLATAAPALSPALVSVVDRATAYEKADRWESAAAMQQALRRVMSGAAHPAAVAPAVAVMGAAPAVATGAVSPSAPASRLMPVAPSVTSVTSVTAMSSPGLTSVTQGTARRSHVLIGAGIGAVFMLVGLLIVGQALRRSPPRSEATPSAATGETLAQPTTTPAPEPEPVPTVAPAAPEARPPSSPSASPEASVAPKPTAAPVTATPAAPEAPRPPAQVQTAAPAKPKPAPGSSAKPSKSGDWLDRQH